MQCVRRLPPIEIEGRGFELFGLEGGKPNSRAIRVLPFNDVFGGDAGRTEQLGNRARVADFRRALIDLPAFVLLERVAQASYTNDLVLGKVGHRRRT